MHTYIHIPFCRQKCPYCKFALTPIFDDLKKKRYIGYLKREISEYFSLSSRGTRDLYCHTESNSNLEEIKILREREKQFGQIPRKARNDKQIQTIYFGGGTPSVLSLDEVQEILECFPGTTDKTEITLEANPEDITEEYVRGIFVLGVNRISLGVQTLNNISLKEIHRSDRESIVRALEGIYRVIPSSCAVFDGLGNETDSSYRRNDKKRKNISINIDFILGLPHVRKGETLSHIQELHTLFPGITHTSVYMLEDESYPKHWKEISITEDDMQQEFLEIMEYFAKIGWNHYELSNFAKPGYESIHNRSYWNHSNYRGFGLSASSYEDGRRWTNARSFSGYYAGKREDEEDLTLEQIAIEKMMFGLRTGGIDSSLGGKSVTIGAWGEDTVGTVMIDGSTMSEASTEGVPLREALEIPLGYWPPTNSFGTFGNKSTEKYIFNKNTRKNIEQLISDKLLEINDSKIKPTKTGIFLLDHIMGKLV